MRPEIPAGVEMLPVDRPFDGVAPVRCPTCRWWWTEQIVDADGALVVRDWHQTSCPWYPTHSAALTGDPGLARTLGPAVGLPTSAPADHANARARLAAPHTGLDLETVLTRIDDADPGDEGPDHGVSVWEDPERLTAQVWAVLAEPMGLDFYFRYGCPDAAADLRMTSSAGLRPDDLPGIRVLGAGTFICGRVANRRAMEAHSNVHLSTSDDLAPSRALGTRSLASFPVLRGDTVVGTFAVGSFERPVLTDHELLVLRAMAHLIGQASQAADGDLPADVPRLTETWTDRPRMG
ncbi:MAG: GAF domain-containing protein [Nocardioidaceae bacterium]|nr:GAF domain-containing protein [Nocardioidaceae bacterium]